jgi:hypothetical protein
MHHEFSQYLHPYLFWLQSDLLHHQTRRTDFHSILDIAMTTKIGGRFSGTVAADGNASISFFTNTVNVTKKKEDNELAINFQRPPKPEHLIRDIQAGIVNVHESKRHKTPSEIASQITQIQSRPKLKIPLPHGVNGCWSPDADVALKKWLADPARDILRRSTLPQLTSGEELSTKPPTPVTPQEAPRSQKPVVPVQNATAASPSDSSSTSSSDSSSEEEEEEEHQDKSRGTLNANILQATTGRKRSLDALYEDGDPFDNLAKLGFHDLMDEAEMFLDDDAPDNANIIKHILSLARKQYDRVLDP